MNNCDYVLSCESTADLTRGQLEAADINYVPFHFALGEKEYLDDLGQSVPFESFYAEMADGAETRTAQVNISEYADYFTPFLEAGKDVVHVCLSSGLTGAINSARNAARILEERFPERNIYIVDSLAASAGYGLLMLTAAERRDAGMSAGELADWIEKNRLRLNHWFFSTDLSAYVRGGRISKTAAVFGGVLEICPMLNVDELGRLAPKEKIRTKKRAVKEIVKRMEQHAEGGTEYSGKCFVAHSDCEEDAKAIAEAVEQTFPKLDGKVQVNWVGTAIGSHTGPGSVGLFFWGDERVS